MKQEYKTGDKQLPRLRGITALGTACFGFVLAMWFGVDLNGSFMGIGERLTPWVAVIISLTGCWANYRIVRQRLTHRFIAVVMGFFCLYVFCDVLRTFF